MRMAVVNLATLSQRRGPFVALGVAGAPGASRPSTQASGERRRALRPVRGRSVCSARQPENAAVRPAPALAAREVRS